MEWAGCDYTVGTGYGVWDMDLVAPPAAICAFFLFPLFSPTVSKSTGRKECIAKESRAEMLLYWIRFDSTMSNMHLIALNGGDNDADIGGDDGDDIQHLQLTLTSNIKMIKRCINSYVSHLYLFSYCILQYFHLHHRKKRRRRRKDENNMPSCTHQPIVASQPVSYQHHPFLQLHTLLITSIEPLHPMLTTRVWSIFLVHTHVHVFFPLEKPSIDQAHDHTYIHTYSPSLPLNKLPTLLLHRAGWLIMLV